MIGAGTGLGEAYLVWESGRCYCYASEGGHCSFSPNDERQDRLLGWLRRQFDHVSFERVLSGPGLVNVYRFLVESEGRQELDSTRARMLEEDPAAVVSGLALLDEDPVCAEALDLFSTLYGIEAGNLALKVLATGGIYVAGGIAPRILPKLTDGSFLRGFRFKGRHSDLMQSIPVHVITNPKVGLRGAAAHAGGLI
jgi:glucokinase